MNQRIRTIAALITMLFFAVSVGACGDSSTAPDTAPQGHSVIKDGVAHMPGLETPTNGCVQCHGDDLMGGTDDEPSCYACHGKKW